MISFFIFILSGLIIVTMLVAKRIEERKKTGVFFLKLVSRGDKRARELHHKALHYYSLGKDRTYLWITKHLPLRARNSWNKFQAFVKESAEKYTGDMRNIRLLKRSDGISEFFKSISDIEKGVGKINEVYEDREAIVAVEKIESAPVPAKAPRARRKSPAPKKKRLTVVESE